MANKNSVIIDNHKFKGCRMMRKPRANPNFSIRNRFRQMDRSRRNDLLKREKEVIDG